MADDRPERPEAEQNAWEEHNRSQLRYFRSLSLREKMQAVEGMADVLRRFKEMRERGEFTTAHPNTTEPQAESAPAVREPTRRYDSDK